MNIDDRKRLFVYKDILVDNLIFNEIEDHLYQNKVISSEELKLISQEKTYEAQIRKLLSLIVKKPELDLLKRFCLALQETGNTLYKQLGEDLLEVDISDVKANEYELEFIFHDNIEFLASQFFTQFQDMLQESGKVFMRRCEEEENILHSLESGNLVTKHMSEFITKPPEDFTEIERKGCQMGLESYLCYVSPSIRPEFEEYLSDDIHDVDGTGKAVDEAVITMSRLVRSEDQMNKNSISKMVREMNGYELNGFHTMNSIADKLFCFGKKFDRDRIVTWFSFWGWFVNNLRPLESDDPVQLVRFCSEFAGFYLAKRLQSSIADAGGWMSLIGPS